MNDAHESFANFDEEMHIPSCNFCLKKRPDELAQFKTRLQFGRAHQPVRTNPWLSFVHKELWVMWKLSSIAVGVIQVWHSHVEAKKCYGSKITKDKLIKVMIGLAKWWESIIRSRDFSIGQMSWRIQKVIQELVVASRLCQCDSCFKDIAI
jgi:hypothetical protein